MNEFTEFDMVVVLHIRQRGVDRIDAVDRAQASLTSALRDKLIMPEEHMRLGFWDESLATRVQRDRLGHIGQVLMIAPSNEPGCRLTTPDV